MSLGDELRYLRARAGGLAPDEIQEATGIEAVLYCMLEQRYREMGDDETIEKLAAFFEADADMLKRARSRSRKAFNQYLSEALENQSPLELSLRTGETLSGHLAWWDLGALGLTPEDGGPLIVVQRHAVIDWS
jgi:transcriptional regulator with XRE-family HTH domain